MAEAKRQIPPYVPWRTFENYLDALKAFGPTLPNVIDRDSMRTFSGATQTWLLHALRALNFIDDAGVPRPRLNQIVHASAEARKPFYKQIIEAEYPFTRSMNLQGATPKQLETAFESTGASGDTVRKCMAFFVGLAKAADVPLSPLIGKSRRRSTPRNGAAPKPKVKKRTDPSANAERQSDSVDQPASGFERLPIPGLTGAFIQYPANLTEGNCDLFEAMLAALRTYAKGRSGKEKKS